MNWVCWWLVIDATRRHLGLFLVLLAGCGRLQATDLPAPVPVAEIENVNIHFERDVASFTLLPADRALSRLKELIDEDDPYFIGMGDRNQQLFEETARQGRVDLLEALDAQLGDSSADQDVRWSIHVVVSGDWRDPGMRRVRDQLARRHPESLWLAPYRPGGVEYLLEIVESPAKPIHDRERSVAILSGRGTAEILKRLAPFAGDATEVPGVRNLRVGDPTPTLGSFVTKAMKRIQERTRNSGAQGP